jgi:hypothetical protein
VRRTSHRAAWDVTLNAEAEQQRAPLGYSRLPGSVDQNCSRLTGNPSIGTPGWQGLTSELPTIWELGRRAGPANTSEHHARRLLARSKVLPAGFYVAHLETTQRRGLQRAHRGSQP